MTAASEQRRRLAVGGALGAVLVAAGIGIVVTASDPTPSIAEGPEAAVVEGPGAAIADDAATEGATAEPAGLALPDLEGDLGRGDLDGRELAAGREGPAHHRRLVDLGRAGGGRLLGPGHDHDVRGVGGALAVEGDAVGDVGAVAGASRVLYRMGRCLTKAPGQLQ